MIKLFNKHKIQIFSVFWMIAFLTNIYIYKILVTSQWYEQWWVFVSISLIIFGFLGLKILSLFTEKRINKITDATNEISRIQTSELLKKNLLKHSLSLFGFDYCTLSIIELDLEKDTKKVKTQEPIIPENIKIKHIKRFTNLGKSNPQNWSEKSDHDLYAKYSHNDKKDILIQICEDSERSVIPVFGRFVMDKPTQYKNIFVDNDIFHEYNHEELFRIYVPVVYRYNRIDNKNGNDNKINRYDEDLALGVIEYGIKYTNLGWGANIILWFFYNLLLLSQGRLFSSTLSILISLLFMKRAALSLKVLKSFLLLYADNVAQTLYRIQLYEKEKEIKDKFFYKVYESPENDKGNIKNEHYEPENEIPKNQNRWFFFENLFHTIKKKSNEGKKKESFGKKSIYIQKEKPLDFDKLQDRDKQFAQLFLNEICKKVTGAKYGILAFRTLNNRKINFKYRSFYYGLTENDIINLDYDKLPKNEPVGMATIAIEQQRATLSSNVLTGQGDGVHYRKLIRKNDIVSQLVIPLIKSNQVIGLIVLDSDKESFFNIQTVELLNNINSLFVHDYLSLLKYTVYDKIVEPTLSANSQDNFLKNIIKRLGEYFGSDLVLVWNLSDRNRKDDKDLYTFDRCSIQIDYSGLKSFYFNSDFNIDEDNLIEFVNIKEELSSANPKFIKFHNYFDKREYTFYILLKIVIQNKVVSTINIFSKREFIKNDDDGKPINELRLFDYNESNFLIQVVKKIAVTKQNFLFSSVIQKVSSALFDSSDSIKSNESEIPKNKIRLLKIVQLAQELIKADYINIFPYKNQKLNRRDVIGIGVNGEYVSPDVNESELLIPNLIVNEKEYSKVYVSDEKDFQKLREDYRRSRNIDTHVVDKKGYREKNGIVAVAAHRIEYEGQVLGAIIFNFKRKIIFLDKSDNLEIANLIEDFVGFIGVELRRLYFMDNLQNSYSYSLRDLNELRDVIDIEKENYAKEKNNFEKLKIEQANQTKKFNETLIDLQREKTQLKILYDESLNSATRKNFYMLVQGHNEAIKNALFNLNEGLNSFIITTKEDTSTEKMRDLENSVSVLSKNVDNIKHFLDAFRFNINDSQEFEIKEVVEKLSKIISVSFYNLKYIEFICTIEDDLPKIKMNSSELQMMLYCLINNSIMACKNKSETLSKQGTTSYKGHVHLKISFQKNDFVFTVSDNGSGISDDMKLRMYKLNETSKIDIITKLPEKGAGIGLFYVKELVSSCHGVIAERTNIKNEKYITEFTIKIPLN
jgi:nitrogen-specific signal transduction histidine kinase